MDAPASRRLSTKLAEHSARLEELTLQLHRLGPRPLGPELLDELAVSVDELLLTLDEHRHLCGTDVRVDSVIREARTLMRGVRAHALGRE
jgi:hypothetical protein